MGAARSEYRRPRVEIRVLSAASVKQRSRRCSSPELPVRWRADNGELALAFPPFFASCRRDTAVSAIRAVYPDADIKIERLDEYPVQVVIKEATTGRELWKGGQRRLFRKYAADRARSIEEIQQALKALA